MSRRSSVPVGVATALLVVLLAGCAPVGVSSEQTAATPPPLPPQPCTSVSRTAMDLVQQGLTDARPDAAMNAIAAMSDGKGGWFVTATFTTTGASGPLEAVWWTADDPTVEQPVVLTSVGETAGEYSVFTAGDVDTDTPAVENAMACIE